MNYGSYRYTRAEIDLNKLSYNVNKLKEKLSSHTKFMAVIKADAYGHGAVEIGKHLEQLNVDYLAVAVLDEAMELREAGITSPILLLSPIEPDTIPVAIEHDIAVTVYSKDIASAVYHHAERMQKNVIVHLKIDSGMGRIGVRNKEDALMLCQTLKSDFIHIEGIYTHFAEAENLEDPTYTKKQYERFIAIVEDLKHRGLDFDITHCCNTAAALAYPEYHLDMIRTGISLFGYHPDETMTKTIDLKPIMTIVTHAAFIKDVEAGESIGYGRSFITSKPSKIATILLGYADGIPRELSNRWYLNRKNEKAPIIGRICMDQLMVDVTDIEGFSKDNELVYIGDPAEGYPSIYTMADMSDSFHYEILCGIGKRIPRVYIKNDTVEVKQNYLLD
ncbi:alanine racemase [Alkalibacterium sp. MB6]|uniref:alanine racemase n=1 Tax=Alkalibacterium sp. MB6 TaxID=2081965 RepID=UPI00137964C0|nr:alanine racemase [Alkalibacterium sp. MB6]